MSDHGEIYGDEVVEEYWHYDGPHDEDHTNEAAIAIARLVRYLNNATGPGHAASALPHAATAYRVINDLAHAVKGLQQLLPQLAAFLERQANDPSLYDDRRGGPDAPSAPDTARAAAYALQQATRDAIRLAQDLSAAAGHAGHLGNR